MTFEEMQKKYDSFDAFNGFMTIKYAKAIRLFSEEYDDVFPETCSCGSDMIINYARTKITCCNPRCYLKQGYALSELFSRFNIKGIGDAICSTAYKALQEKNQELIDAGKEGIFVSDSFVEVLLIDEDKYPLYFSQTVAGSDFIKAASVIKSKIVTFSDLIGKLGLPEFDSTSYKLFDSINSFAELQQAIKSEGGIDNFCSNRGVYAPMKWFWLKASLPDIAVAEFIFGENIRVKGLQQLDICITGSLYFQGQRVTKRDYVLLCNNKSFSRPMGDILRELLSEREEFNRAALEAIGKLLNGNIVPSADKDLFTAAEVMAYVDSLDLAPVQILEIRMTTAKKSVQYIVADSPSNSAKYLEGLRRGEEIDENGERHKVLITSDEFYAVIAEKVNKWEKELISQCRKAIPSENLMTLF